MGSPYIPELLIVEGPVADEQVVLCHIVYEKTGYGGAHNFMPYLVGFLGLGIRLFLVSIRQVNKHVTFQVTWAAYLILSHSMLISAPSRFLRWLLVEKVPSSLISS